MSLMRFDLKRLCGLPLLLLCLMLSSGAGASANDTVSGSNPIPLAPAQDDPFAAVDACLQQEMSRNSMPGASMAIAIEGELAHASAFGYRRRDELGRVDTDTIFRINSTTKMMGAAAVMQLVEQGKVDLHTPITDYIPDLRIAEPWNASSLTLHTLLTTSGAMPDPYFDFSAMPELYEMPAWDVDLGGWANMLGGMHLYAPPGSFWNYSSPNFSLAGLAVERVTGMSWEDYIVENLYRPAGMEVATFDPEALRASGNYANGHYQDKIYEPEEFQRPYAYPAGGAYTTPTELIAWVLQLMEGGGEILSPVSVELMTTPHMKAESLPWARRSGYGYGIFIEDFRRIDDPTERVAVYQHPGNGRGLGTELYWVPEQGFAIATLVNRHGTMRDTVDCAMRLLAGLERTPQSGQGLPPSSWGRYAGSYAVQDVFGTRWTAHVEKQGNQLRIHHPDWQMTPALREAIPEPVAMSHRYYDTFDSRYVADRIVTFEPGGADPEHAGWLRNQYFVGQHLGQLPPRLDIMGRACASLDLVSGHDVVRPRVRVYGLTEPEVWPDEPIAQEDPDDPSSSRFKLDLEIGVELGYLSAWLFKEDDDLLGMYLMQDQDEDGRFTWPEELVERIVGVGGHATGQALFVSERSVPGPYQLWVHGQQVSGAGSRYRVDLVSMTGGDGDLRIEGLPERMAVGEPTSFEICADPTAEGSADRVGLVEIDFGAPGALGRVPIYWQPDPEEKPRAGTIHLPWLTRDAL